VGQVEEEGEGGFQMPEVEVNLEEAEMEGRPTHLELLEALVATVGSIQKKACLAVLGGKLLLPIDFWKLISGPLNSYTLDPAA
jgi:hypothetical protein